MKNIFSSSLIGGVGEETDIDRLSDIVGHVEKINEITRKRDRIGDINLQVLYNKLKIKSQLNKGCYINDTVSYCIDADKDIQCCIGIYNINFLQDSDLLMVPNISDVETIVIPLYMERELGEYSPNVDAIEPICLNWVVRLSDMIGAFPNLKKVVIDGYCDSRDGKYSGIVYFSGIDYSTDVSVDLLNLRLVLRNDPKFMKITHALFMSGFVQQEKPHGEIDLSKLGWSIKSRPGYFYPAYIMPSIEDANVLSFGKMQKLYVSGTFSTEDIHVHIPNIERFRYFGPDLYKHNTYSSTDMGVIRDTNKQYHALRISDCKNLEELSGLNLKDMAMYAIKNSDIVDPDHSGYDDGYEVKFVSFARTIRVEKNPLLKTIIFHECETVLDKSILDDFRLDSSKLSGLFYSGLGFVSEILKGSLHLDTLPMLDKVVFSVEETKTNKYAKIVGELLSESKKNGNIRSVSAKLFNHCSIQGRSISLYVNNVFAGDLIQRE